MKTSGRAVVGVRFMYFELKRTFYETLDGQRDPLPAYLMSTNASSTTSIARYRTVLPVRFVSPRGKPNASLTHFCFDRF